MGWIEGWVFVYVFKWLSVFILLVRECVRVIKRKQLKCFFFFFLAEVQSKWREDRKIENRKSVMGIFASFYVPVTLALDSGLRALPSIAESMRLPAMQPTSLGRKNSSTQPGISGNKHSAACVPCLYAIKAKLMGEFSPAIQQISYFFSLFSLPLCVYGRHSHSAYDTLQCIFLHCNVTCCPNHSVYCTHMALISSFKLSKL